MNLSAFIDTDSRICCKAIIELLGSLEDILKLTDFNKHGITEDTPDVLKAALKKYMERKREYIMDLCGQFSQGKFSLVHLESAFSAIHYSSIKPFVERFCGDGKHMVQITNSKTGKIDKIVTLPYLIDQAQNVFDIFTRIKNTGIDPEKDALVKELKLYLSIPIQCIDGSHDDCDKCGQTRNHESPVIDDSARKLIKEDIIDFIYKDLNQMSQSRMTLFTLVKQDDKALLFAQFKGHFESSFKVHFDNGKAKSFDDAIKFYITNSIDNGEYGVGFIDHIYSILALCLYCEVQTFEDGPN
ncbi:hypothetical protein H4219_005547 [Mycoemilia scoparia]|uniref:Uncharacterized protein n=1 Tax=Mycoemilia scoparia TaxID=417184 RepID=A0A9W8DPB2_9FUNG|nr:hypothetical protein H4219_005547 [Mycoemilia scoparia]